MGTDEEDTSLPRRLRGLNLLLLRRGGQSLLYAFCFLQVEGDQNVGGGYHAGGLTVDNIVAYMVRREVTYKNHEEQRAIGGREAEGGGGGGNTLSS